MWVIFSKEKPLQVLVALSALTLPIAVSMPSLQTSSSPPFLYAPPPRALCKFPGDTPKLWGPTHFDPFDCHPPVPLGSQKPRWLATWRHSCRPGPPARSRLWSLLLSRDRMLESGQENRCALWTNLTTEKHFPVPFKGAHLPA